MAEDEKACRVVVPDNQLSLAIGKEGQNARLAAKLTGWRIDIKSQSQAVEMFALPQELYEEPLGFQEFIEEPGEAFDPAAGMPELSDIELETGDEDDTL